MDQHPLFGFQYVRRVEKASAQTGIVRPGDYLVDESGYYLTDQDGNMLVGGREFSWRPWLGDSLTFEPAYFLTDESGFYLTDQDGGRLEGLLGIPAELFNTMTDESGNRLVA